MCLYIALASQVHGCPACFIHPCLQSQRFSLAKTSTNISELPMEIKIFLHLIKMFPFPARVGFTAWKHGQSQHVMYEEAAPCKRLNTHVIRTGGQKICNLYTNVHLLHHLQRIFFSVCQRKLTFSSAIHKLKNATCLPCSGQPISQVLVLNEQKPMQYIALQLLYVHTQHCCGPPKRGGLDISATGQITIL